MGKCYAAKEPSLTKQCHYSNEAHKECIRYNEQVELSQGQKTFSTFVIPQYWRFFPLQCFKGSNEHIL